MIGPVSTRQQTLSPADRLAQVIATGAGAGFMPVAPGTFGAIEAVLLYLAVAALRLPVGGELAVMLGLDALSFAAGWWASARSCRVSGLKDPSHIVVDEINGQLIALTPLAFHHSAPGVLLAFLLFRTFDIFKPYPIGSLERLPGGLGVMADDTLAGIYAAAILGVVLYTGVI